MKKRGISPLIATVLIIGFTVALAAIIMTWGQSFIKKTQETTTETTNIALICAQEVKPDIKEACYVPGNGSCSETTQNQNVDCSEKSTQSECEATAGCEWSWTTEPSIKVTIANDGQRDIIKYTLRFYHSPTDIKTWSSEKAISKFAVDTIELTPANVTDLKADEVKAVEIIPTIDIEGKEQVCAQSGDKFGDEAGSPILECT